MIEYIILGALQGIFEWIPISSQGIVALVSQFFVEEFNPVELALFLHLGTLLAAFIYFWKDWKEILMFRNIKLLRFLLISTIISLAIGFPLFKIAKDMAFGYALLIMMGFGLLLTAYFNKKNLTFNIKFDKLAIIAGFLQGLSVIPGVSRSGSTIFGLSLGKIEPAEILKISYLMSVPVVFASTLYLFLRNPDLALQSWPGLISSFFIGILSLDFLLKISRRINFFNFLLIFAFLCFLGAILEILI